MSQWIGEIYEVDVDELDVPTATKFAKEVVDEDVQKNNLFDRYKYSIEKRKEVVKNGKLAEQAFAIFLKKEFGISVEIDYAIYPGVFEVDKNDLRYNGFDIDVKSSKDTKNEGIDNCLKYFNFPVPVDQQVKDITVSILYTYDIDKFYIVAWIDRVTYEHNRTHGYFTQEEKHFRKFPLKEGYRPKDLKIIFDKRTKFIEFIMRNRMSYEPCCYCEDMRPLLRRREIEEELSRTRKNHEDVLRDLGISTLKDIDQVSNDKCLEVLAKLKQMPTDPLCNNKSHKK